MSRTRQLAICLILSVLAHVCLLVYIGTHWTTLPELTRTQQRYALVTLLEPPLPKVTHAPPPKATPPAPHPRLRLSRGVNAHPSRRIAARPASRVNSQRAPHPAPIEHGAKAVAAPIHADPPEPKVVAMTTPKAADIAAAPSNATADPDVDTGPAPGTGAASGTGDASSAGSAGSGGSAPYWPFGLTPGDGGGGGPLHIVYVLDVSASMTSRIDHARGELRHALETMRPGESFDVISFCRDVGQLSDGLLPATSTNVSAAKGYVEDVSLCPGTNLEAAMREALGLPGVNVLVVITDGVPTVGETSFGKLAHKIARWNASGARIYTVGLVGRNPDGSDDTFEATQLLRTISRDSNGASEIYRLGVATPE